MAKDEDLDIAAPSPRRASHKGDQPAQEQVDEGEKHGSSLLSERPDPTKALLTRVDQSFCAPQDHGRLKARLRPMRGLQQDRSARIAIAGCAFIQNVRRGHYEPAVEELASRRLAVAFAELALML
jgi:hypothetical protein